MAELTQADREFLAEACGVTTCTMRVECSSFIDPRCHMMLTAYILPSRVIIPLSDWKPDSDQRHLAIVLREVERRKLLLVLGINLTQNIQVPEHAIVGVCHVLRLMASDTGVAAICAAALEVLKEHDNERSG